MKLLVAAALSHFPLKVRVMSITFGRRLLALCI
jgi:hypothetical protein